MARGGINKAPVKQARDEVLLKGQNPSIDAVRIALGNTGSKTTIHRYLKEIEEGEGTRLDDEALLSSTLKDMIAKMASQLHEEANNLIERNKEHYESQISSWRERYESLENTNKEFELKHDEQATLLDETKAQNRALQDKLNQISSDKQALDQKLTDLQAMLADKNKHIESLEEKHKHSREALEHYRNSVKDQRDQDLRRHESQVQQLQVEIRNLNQTLSIKQTDITQLNKDNAQLVTELNATQKELSASNNKLKASDSELASNARKLANMELSLDQLSQQEKTVTQERNKLKEQFSLALEDLKLKELDSVRLQSELDTKNQLFDKLTTATHQASGINQS